MTPKNNPGLSSRKSGVTFPLLQPAGVVGAAEDIVGGDVIKVGQFDQVAQGQLVGAALIAAGGDLCGIGQPGHSAAESEYREPRHLKETSSAVVHYLFPLGRMWQVQQ